MQLFWNLTLKNQRSRSWVRSKVKVTYFTQYPTNAPPFCFTSIGPTIPEICPIDCLTLKKHIRNFLRKFGKKKEQSDVATKFCSDRLSGSHFILQTSKFLFIKVTAVTLGQGHPKVIQYIFPDLYFHCPKYLRSSANGFGVRSKSHCGGGGGGRGRGRGGGNELKT